MSTPVDPESGRYLRVPGARLYYDVSGSGPLLLMIPGGAADASIFDTIGPVLAAHHTVVKFDPRGISRSHRDDPAERLTLDDLADDAGRVLTALDAGPADVLGCSGGAVIGLALVERHPERVRTLVAHEPPVVSLLPDDDERRSLASAVYDTYRAEGVGPAMQIFLALTGLGGRGPQPETPPEQQVAMAEQRPRMQQNVGFFLDQYLLPITEYVPDVSRLRSAPTRVVVGVGADSGGQLAHDTALALADRLGSPAATFPGDHSGFVGYPETFAAKLGEVLQAS